jgi:hypothetical protein
VTERGADAQSLGDLLEHEQEAEHASELRGPRELDGLVELAPQQAAEGFDAGDDSQAAAGEVAGTQATTPAASARSGGAHGQVAPVGRAGPLQLLCGTGKPRLLANLSEPLESAVADATAPSKPTPPLPVGTDESPGSSLATRSACAAPLAGAALRRQSFAISAVCASERPYGSARGVPGNRYPYRDRYCNAGLCVIPGTPSAPNPLRPGRQRRLAAHPVGC